VAVVTMLNNGDFRLSILCYSRVFHPCSLVPRFPVPRFQSPPRKAILSRHSSRSVLVPSTVIGCAAVSSTVPTGCVLSRLITHKWAANLGRAGMCWLWWWEVNDRWVCQGACSSVYGKHA